MGNFSEKDGSDLSTLPKLVFISKDVKTTQKMSITALANRFCERDYDVTLISETISNNYFDYKCDHRLKRLNMNMGIKNCSARAEKLAYFVSRLPASVFILTDFDSEAFQEYPAVIKAQSSAHKVICLPHFLLASEFDSGLLAHERLLALAGHTDAFVSNFIYDHVIHHNRLLGKSVFFPYFYPYAEGEFRAVDPGGKTVLLYASGPDLVTKTMEELAAFMKSDAEITLKVAVGANNAKAVRIYKESADALGLADRIAFDESGSFGELAHDCAFAVITSKFVYPCDAFLQLTARQLPVLFASSYYEPAFLSVDLARGGTLACKCAEIMVDPAQAQYHANLSAQASARTFSLWESLVADVAAGQAPRGACEMPEYHCEEAYVAHFDAIQGKKRSAQTVKPPSARKRMGEWFRKKIYYRELRRVSKYVAMQMSPEQIRKAQLLASKMLLAFERICQKHGLRYYVAAGSLLGAARHGGPIPWDDDVDVTMPRKDYEAFLRIARNELPEDMELPQNNFPYGFHRIQMKGTRLTRLIRQKGARGVFIDILPLDGAAPTQTQRAKHKRLNRTLLDIMAFKSKPLPLLKLNRLRMRECAKRLIIKVFAPKRLLFWLWKRNATRYDIDTASAWVCLPGAYPYEEECFPKEYWGEPARLEYESRTVPVMHQWEKYLCAHYGDYMMPTPVLCRRTHQVIAVDFGRYESMTVQEIEDEVEAYGRTAQNR